ncbi:hypothetical protein [Desulfovibrio ferrophilus]|nr:hypothetical protein [Desulfovibrio ferrophilus]
MRGSASYGRMTMDSPWKSAPAWWVALDPKPPLKVWGVKWA